MTPSVCAHPKFEPPPGLSVSISAQPVSLQGSRSSRDRITGLVAQAIADFAWHWTGDVEITIEWLGPEHSRYERSDSPDLDNIIKPILDALKGPAGCLIDDCQVQSIRASWIDLRRDQPPRIQLDVAPYDRDDVIASEGLVMVRVAPTLCVPSTFYPEHRLRVVRSDRIVEAFGRVQSFIEEFGEDSRDVADDLRPIQRPFATARVADFDVLDLAAYRDGKPPGQPDGGVPPV